MMTHTKAAQILNSINRQKNVRNGSKFLIKLENFI